MVATQVLEKILTFIPRLQKVFQVIQIFKSNVSKINNLKFVQCGAVHVLRNTIVGILEPFPN